MKTEELKIIRDRAEAVRLSIPPAAGENWAFEVRSVVAANVPMLCNEVERLQAAIRKHRDQRGDDRCYLDDRELYAALPEGYTPPPFDTAVEIENCRKFIECRRDPATTYVSPQREIEKLKARIEILEPMVRNFRDPMP